MHHVVEKIKGNLGEERNIWGTFVQKLLSGLEVPW